MPTKKKTVPAQKVVAKKTFNQIAGEVENREVEDPAVRSRAVARAKQAVSAASNITAEAAVEALSKASVGINKTLSELQAKILDKIQEYSQIDEAIEARTEELQNLFDKEAVLLETSALMARYRAAQADLAQAETDQQKTFQERQAERQKTWQREDADYQYNLQQKRRKIEDDYAQKDKEQLRNLFEREETYQKNWTEREAALKGKEEEFTALKGQVADFAKTLTTEVDKAVAIATNSLKRDLEHKFALEKANLQTELRLAQQQTSQDASTIKVQQAEIERLRAEVSSANGKIVDISKSGFESVSGQRALGALTDFASSNGPPAKSKS